MFIFPKMKSLTNKNFYIYFSSTVKRKLNWLEIHQISGPDQSLGSQCKPQDILVLIWSSFNPRRIRNCHRIHRLNSPIKKWHFFAIFHNWLNCHLVFWCLIIRKFWGQCLIIDDALSKIKTNQKNSFNLLKQSFTDF